MPRRPHDIPGALRAALAAGLLAVAPAAAGPDGWSERRAAIESGLGSNVLERRREALDRAAAADRPEAADLIVAAAIASARRIETDLALLGVGAEAKLRRYYMDRGAGALTPKQAEKFAKRREEIDRELHDLDGQETAEREFLAGAARALGRLRAEAAARRVIEATRAPSPWRSKRAFAAALGALDSPLAAPRLAEILGSAAEEPAVRVAAAEALGSRPAGEALGRLLAALPAAPAPVQWSILRALERLDAPGAVKPLVDFMKSSAGRTRESAQAALRALTGEAKPATPEAWAAWWAGAEEGFAEARGDRAARAARLAAAARGGNVDTVPTFHGLPVTAKAVVFCIDCSVSMGEPCPAEGPNGAPLKARRFDVAVAELRRTLRSLPPDTRFNVIFFCLTRESFAGKGLVAATPANVQRAEWWAGGIAMDYGTGFFDALEAAFNFGRGSKAEVDPSHAAEAVYILTDGEPTTGPLLSSTAIRRRIRDLNLVSRVAVHTVAYAADARAAAFLRALAEENGGRFTSRGAAAGR